MAAALDISPEGIGAENSFIEEIAWKALQSRTMVLVLDLVGVTCVSGRTTNACLPATLAQKQGAHAQVCPYLHGIREDTRLQRLFLEKQNPLHRGGEMLCPHVVLTPERLPGRGYRALRDAVQEGLGHRASSL